MRQYPLYASILKTFFSQHTENTEEKKLLKQFSFLKNQQPPTRQNVRMFFFSDSSLFLRVLLSFLVICHPFWLFFLDGPVSFIFFSPLRERPETCRVALYSLTVSSHFFFLTGGWKFIALLVSLKKKETNERDGRPPRKSVCVSYPHTYIYIYLRFRYSMYIPLSFATPKKSILAFPFFQFKKIASCPSSHFKKPARHKYTCTKKMINVFIIRC